MEGHKDVRLFERVLSDPALVEDPPILVDIGAAGGATDWLELAPYSVCVAFDPDAKSLDSGFKNHPYKRLHLFPSVVTPDKSETAQLYETRGSLSSSLLTPNETTLEVIAIREGFEVLGVRTVNALTLKEALQEVGAKRVDWFKCDAQGMDLRLLKSLAEEMISRTLTVALEPHVLSLYEGDDRLGQALVEMESRPFWVSKMEITNTPRSERGLESGLRRWERKLIRVTGPRIPGWANVQWINSFENLHSRRDLLLGWAISHVLEQETFALELARRGYELTQESLFSQMGVYSMKAIRRRYVRLARKTPAFVLRKSLESLRKLESFFTSGSSR